MANAGSYAGIGGKTRKGFKGRLKNRMYTTLLSVQKFGAFTSVPLLPE